MTFRTVCTEYTSDYLYGTSIDKKRKSLASKCIYHFLVRGSRNAYISFKLPDKNVCDLVCLYVLVSFCNTTYHCLREFVKNLMCHIQGLHQLLNIHFYLKWVHFTNFLLKYTSFYENLIRQQFPGDL